MKEINPFLIREVGIGTEGILLVDKPKGKTSFSLISALRKKTQIKTIGHAGTLDPLATGVMVLLIGSKFTKQSNVFLGADKKYEATICLGISTDTYDAEGTPTSTSPLVPTLSEIDQKLSLFQGSILQTPPMFSAKKIKGKKLYELARKGIEVTREARRVTVTVEMMHYAYPILDISVQCSKGTYIRSIAHDLGIQLGCGAHLSDLRRTRSGSFQIDDCMDGNLLYDPA